MSYNTCITSYVKNLLPLNIKRKFLSISIEMVYDLIDFRLILHLRNLISENTIIIQIKHSKDVLIPLCFSTAGSST